MRRLTALALTAAAAVALTACDDGNSSAQSEGKSRDSSYDALVKRQPAHHMDYSPTREAINGWIDTWADPNAVSYVYLQSSDGTLLGYYVLKGLPVSYCAGLTPPYRWEDIPGDGEGTDQQVPAPGVDGVYYSGGQCNTYYGFTADTGAYIEYTAGLGINVLLYNQPLPQANNVPNLAPDGGQ